LSSDHKRISMRTLFTLASLLVALSSPNALAATVVVDFEGFSSLDSVTTQVPGLIFANATVLTAGVSLNELEFPPHSGSNVVFDDGGPITIAFLQPVVAIGTYFTYTMPLTVIALDSSNQIVATAQSAFASNDGLFGDPGSSPNEFLQVTFVGGISVLVARGNESGGSFTLDDLTYQTPQTSSIPEPTIGTLAAVGLTFLGCRALTLRRS
jgi:hypothetical protein